MKKFALTILVLLSLGFVAQAGSESYAGKEVKQVVPPPCPEWYRDTEWNVGVWGAYAFTSEDWSTDRYLEVDHAWGGGIDLKYFFHRYFGVGVEGFGLDTNRRSLEIREDESSGNTEPLFDSVKGPHDRRIVGAVLGTLTFRYPFHCSRFSPYIYGGAGAIFGGGETSHFVDDDSSDFDLDRTVISNSDTKFMGQVGGGIEVRITPHIGWINDFNWNFVARSNADFGMVRGGLNFAF
jgi:hypothetical protein